MRLSRRLQRLEEARPPSGARSPRLWLAFVDHDGRILDDGSQETLPWIGMHYQDVPGGVAKVIMGVDPLAMLGREPASSKARDAGSCGKPGNNPVSGSQHAHVKA